MWKKTHQLTIIFIETPLAKAEGILGSAGHFAPQPMDVPRPCVRRRSNSLFGSCLAIETVIADSFNGNRIPEKSCFLEIILLIFVS
jgi:hypothetical protein